jgi:Spy/CpxP family protein refolding chaperone
MKNRTRLTALLLSALVSAPCLSSVAYAHDGWNKAGSTMECEHKHLSEVQLKLIHETMRQLHEDHQQVFKEMHKLHEKQRDILAADTFDKEAFLAVTAQIDKRHEQLDKSRLQAFASIADKFTPEERERLAHMFSHRHNGHGGWRKAAWQHDEGRDGGHRHEGQDNWLRHQRQSENEGNDKQANQTDSQKDYPPNQQR